MVKNTKETRITAETAAKPNKPALPKYPLLDTERITEKQNKTNRNSNVVISNALKGAELTQFIESFDTPEQGRFFYEWINNGLNTVAAYKACYPNSQNEQAIKVRANKLLYSIDKRLRIRAYLEVHGLTEELYFTKLLQGLSDADNKTMKLFHDKLGKVLDIEEDRNQQNIAIGGNKIQVNLVSYLDDNNNDKPSVTT